MNNKVCAASGELRLFILSIGIACALSAAPGAFAGMLRAGAGKADITPPASVFPIKAEREHDFTGVHDNVFARALVLDDGAKRTVLVSLEVAIVPNGEQVVKSVADVAKVAPANVMVFATHTHSNPLVFYHGHDGTPTHMREVVHVQEGAVAATREALSHLQPARMSVGRGEARINYNSSTGKDGDKSLHLVRVETVTGQPIALLVNYNTHAEVMFRSVTKNGGLEVSGDLPGAVSRLLEDSATAPVVLFAAGAESDLRSLYTSKHAGVGKTPVVDEGAAGWALLSAQAHMLTGSVLQTLAAMSAADADAQIESGATHVTCPGQALVTDHDNGKATQGKGESVDIPLGLVRINNLMLAGVGGDLGSEIGRALKAAFPQRDLMIVSMMAGSIGYIPADSAYARNSRGEVSRESKASSIAAGCAQPALLKGFAELARGR